MSLRGWGGFDYVKLSRVTSFWCKYFTWLKHAKNRGINDDENPGMRSTSFMAMGLITMVMGEMLMTGCARLPYTVRTIHEEERLLVTVEREVERRHIHIPHRSPLPMPTLF